MDLERFIGDLISILKVDIWPIVALFVVFVVVLFLVGAGGR